MAKEQVLVISPPAEISFKGPYNRVVTEQLTLSNPTDSHIAFKVKTTAPKRYCVRPNNGVIAPKKSVTVSVILQSQNREEILSEKHKHKFMIQSVISPAEAGAVEDIFKQAGSGEVMDSKFRCVFEDISAAEVKSPEFNAAPSRLDVHDRPASGEQFNEASGKEHPSSLQQQQQQTQENASAKISLSGAGGADKTDDSKMRDLLEENQRLAADVQALRAKLRSSPGNASGRISGAIPVVANQQQQSPASLNLVLIIVVAIIALIVGVFLGHSR